MIDGKHQMLFSLKQRSKLSGIDAVARESQPAVHDAVENVNGQSHQINGRLPKGRAYVELHILEVAVVKLANKVEVQ